MRVHLTRVSDNEKTGPIPVSTTEADSCPDSCPLKYAIGKDGKPRVNKSGKKVRGPCYAQSGPLAIHWGEVSAGRRGYDWAGLCAEISRLPKGQLWRHNQAGDLPPTKKQKSRIDSKKMRQLVTANRGRRGFTYTHHNPTLASNAALIDEANRAGFTVNLSADNLQEADKKADLNIGPVVAILPANTTGRRITTPAGRPVVICPAQTTDDMDCARCGLCQISNRKSIVGFLAHGRSKAKLG